MTQNTNLNVSPYFDDFNESRNYNKVLFKPGFPVQARELTTLQSILQNQVERFGQHFFKEGSIVIPGSTFYDPSYFSVKIDPNFVNIPVRNYTQFLVDNNIEIQGETSGVRATVVNRITSTESIDGFDTLYVKYNKSGDDGETSTFLNGENLITLSDISFSNTSIEANNQFARCVVSNATAIGSAFSVSEGVFFIRGYFVRVPDSTVILDQYTNTPSYRVGLLLNEEIVTPSNANSDLFDNARGFSNESAPGADRFKISTSLSKKTLDDNNDLDFVELFRIENGIIREQVKTTDYNIFKDELARRTYDESGDYYIKPFNIDVRESLNDRISNRGVYSENQTTQNGNTPSDDIISLQISPGKAYVRGYEIDKISTSSVDIVKPRTTKLKENVAVPIRVGNYVNVNSITGAPTIGFSTSVNLLDRRLNTNNDNGKNEGLTTGFIDNTSAVVIGKARVYDFRQTSLVGVANTVYETRLFDIQTFTNIGIAATTEGVGVGTYIKGKYSGASGFIESMGANDLSFNLNDVKGSFQLNEPILASGLEVGSNVISISDYDFTSTKALHSLAGIGAGNTSFAANLVLDRKRNVFETGSEFAVTGNVGLNTGKSTVTGGGIGDFRELVKVGDIFTYSSGGFANPVYNRVTAVTKSNFSTVGVSSVTGECDGSTANNSPTGINIIDPSLNASDDPGYRIKLANRNISSLNLLDSSYVVRKQITKGIDAGNSVAVFNISDLGGVHTDLYFEPFSSENYVLSIANIKEPLRASQVVVDATLKTVTISGLSRTGSATLTATVKRSKLTSKDKTLTRCSDLIVNRSKYSGSGITTTSFNDGLTYSTVYGTRVQDDEISLNVPDLHRVLAVFESDDKDNPTLPSITAISQSATFTNNIIVGEQIIGASSGAVGRVVSVDSGTKISFVYENDKFFEKDEQVSFKTSGIFANISVLVAGDRNITKSFDVDSGHRYDFADYGRIIRKKDIEEPARKLRIVFDYYSTLETSGVVESINSYTDVNYTNEIPFIVDQRASDVLDLRPRVPVLSANPGSSPFSYYSRMFDGSGSENVVSNKTLIADYSYYQGRVDRIYLTKEGKFEVKKGQPSDTPKTPLPNDEAFAVAVLNLPPYVYNATTDVSVRTIPHKRYTMRDIHSLEHRVRNLEDYTTLTLLETDTKNLSIKDPNTGLDKFKSGFFVDNFRDPSVQNLTGESYFDIDIERGECRPRSTERNVGLGFETVSSKADPVSADYRWITDFADANVTRKGQALLLDYTTESFVDQPFATRTENLNPFHIANYAGSLTLEPEQDFWIEEVPLGTPDVFRIDSTFNAIATMLGVEDRENGGMASSMWNSHEITWGGRELVGTETVASRVTNVDRSRQNIGGGQRTTTTTTTSNDVLQTFERSGIERELNLNLSVGEEVIDLGTKVVGTEIIHNTRTRNVEITGKRLKPNTKYYVFMENTNVTEWCVPKLLPITMTRGSFEEGDIVQTANATIGVPGIASILFRVAQSNHKSGTYNAPRETYGISPYDNSSIPTVYSSSSTILNVDTAGLTMHTKPDHLGWVKKGMPLASKSGNGEATVGDLSLITDDKGSIVISLHIPDPKVASNPKFTTGESTIRLTTSPVNANILDAGGSSAETTYFTSGTRSNTQEQSINIKSPIVDRRLTGNQQDVTRIETNLLTDVIRTNTSVRTDWYDPLAQSFMVSQNEYQDGIFITGGDLYFKTKDNRAPVTVQIRTMRDGSPTTTILPFGQVEIDSSNVVTSDNASAKTEFAFETPVYLQAGYEYAIVLITESEKYLTWITRMGEEDVLLNSISNTQPYLGSLFKSQNSSTWTPSQLEDLKFTLKKAKFVTNTPSIVLLDNAELNSAHIRRQNPVFAYSKRANVSIGITDTAFTVGNEVTQTVSGVTHTGRIFAKGGPINYGTTSIDYVSGTGIGLTNGTFTGIGFTSLTGYGGGAEATVVVGGGTVSSIEITTNGEGYAPGDFIMANALGATGTGVRAVVGVAASTNLLVVDNISDQFVDSQAITYINTAGANTVLPGAGVNVNNDTTRDGTTMLFDHHNHGMHSSQNKVKIEDFKSDVPTTTLSAKVEDDSTTISLTDGSLFGTFEGGAIGVANTGYIKIDNEILSYTSINSNDIDITAASRAIDDSLKSIHESGSVVEKYEFNGISLRKINREHDLSDKEKTFNSYHIELADKRKPFLATKAGGGGQVKVSQNIPFEIIDPRLNTITPSGTDVTARIKTTSGTSLSGNEASFTDKGYENVALNKMNYLDDPRIVASKVNEYGILNSEKSFGLELTLSTINEHVSPVVDLETANVVLISSLIDNKVTDFTTDSRPRVPGMDPNSAIYETKRINLEFPSNSIQVMFDGHRDAEANFRVFYKLYRNDAVDVQQNYLPFNTNGLSDKTVNPNTTLNAFSEYKYTAENTPQFNGFMIKIVMTSNTQANPPRLKNFRAIALRSFEIT